MTPDPVQFSPRTIALLRQLQQAPQLLRSRLAQAMDHENQITIGHIQLRYLSFSANFVGPVDGLRVRTNRLRGSLWAAKARPVAGQLVSSIGTNVNYAGVHEYGFSGPVQVRAFTRRNKALDVFRVVEIGEFDLASGRITRRKAKRKRERIAQGISRVRAHTRHAHYAERAPIRRGIADRIPAMTVALEQAALSTLGGAR